MIVRNEAAVLLRCLEAARPVLDAAVICDTGSEDRTVDLATRWLRRHCIPGEVHRHSFRGFGLNRTLALETAQGALRRLAWDLERTYLLFLDADMVLEVADGFRAENLHDDVYEVRQRLGGIVYPNVRLARASLVARYVGSTHEYFAAPGGATVARLDMLTIDDRADGGSRSDKFKRDRRLLRAELRRNSKNARAMFYLAQTYRTLGDRPRALSWYARRIASGGWIEEIWYSHYSTGLIHLDADRPLEAIRSFRTALRIDPGRAEPYYHLARYLRTKGRHLFAARLALKGLALPYPADRRLFLEKDLYDWGLKEELAASGFLTRFREQACAANEALALGSAVPRGAAAVAASASALFAEPLAGATYTPLAPRMPDPYVPCNPSILRTADGYLINCRAVSYRLDLEQRYLAREPDGIFRTRNYLLDLDPGLRVLDQREIIARFRSRRRTQVRGLEDCRLVALGSGLAVTCTTLDLHPQSPVRMSLIDLDEIGHARRHVPLTGYGDDRPQKNWLPFVDGASGELKVVYGYAPFVVLRVDVRTGRCEPVFERPEPRPFEHLRGSAGPIPLPAEVGGGVLLLVHGVEGDGLRRYYHRFLLADEQWRITRVSRPFCFHYRGIEFASGACVAHGDAELLIAFGVDDAEAWLCRIPLRTVVDLLLPLPD